ncbi:hypothetical protein CBS101457_004994 [Exobasidium rhododendri]|nr:hypothetical protein CBS101457_004994 [Exobasidium rhododendri]
MPSGVLVQGYDEAVEEIPQKIAIISYEEYTQSKTINSSSHEGTMSQFLLALAEANANRGRPATAILAGSTKDAGLSLTGQDLFDRRLGLDPFGVYRAIAEASMLVLSMPENITLESLAEYSSWGVSASIITGTPLAASEEVFANYPHLALDTAVATKPGENHLQAAFRQHSAPVLSHTRKRRNLATLRTSLLTTNKHKLHSWLKEDVLNPKSSRSGM